MKFKELESLRFGTFLKLLQALEQKSYGYELHKKTGIPLKYIYDILPILMEMGWLGIEYEGERKKKFMYLQGLGMELLDIFKGYYRFRGTKCKAVFFDLDGVIFEKPWCDPKSDKVAVSTWNLLFKKVKAYEEHELLRKLYESGVFKSYNEWTNEAVKFLKGKLSKKDFEDVVRSRKYNDGAIDVLKTLKENGKYIAIISGSFEELANRVKNDLGEEVEVHAYCSLIFNEKGELTSWSPKLTDYKDKSDLLKHSKFKLSEIAYIAGGVNDIPALKTVKRSGGLAIAFDAENEKVRKSASIIVDGRDLKSTLPYLGVSTSAGKGS